MAPGVGWKEYLTNLLDDPAVHSMVINYRDITERKQYEQEIINLAKFPSEDPHPILRLSQDGIVMYANPASNIFMKNWGCEEGGIAPSFWRELAAQALVSKENQKCRF